MEQSKQRKKWGHGHTSGRKFTPTYTSWAGMKNRCFCKSHIHYDVYGGSGITVCERWMKFENFLADMGERPPGTSLDRYPNREGNYEPGNCRWATWLEQAKNRKEFRRANALKTHCPSGHLYDAANTRIQTDGSRKCRECDRLRALAKRRRLKDAN